MKTTFQTSERLLLSTLILILLLPLLAACRGKDVPLTVPVGAQAGDLVDMQLCIYEADDVEFLADCGTLVVPENRDDPGARLIALPVIRVRATGDDPVEPIFRFAGGPGMSNMSFSLVPWFIQKHDVVIVGYRGIDGSVVLDCPEIHKVFRTSGGDMLSEPALNEISTAVANCAERLQQDEGIDIDGYTATEIIKDIDDARTALGYEQINLLSWSWGTTLARIYGSMYPESIYRSAMISVDTPGAIIHEPKLVDEMIEYYADLCAQDTACSSRTDDLAGTIRKISHNMPERWLFLPINAGLIKTLTYNFLESPAGAAEIIDVWLSAAEGDPSGMAALTLFGPYVFANASNWGHNAAIRSSMGQFDSPWDYLELNPPDSIIGSPVTTISYAEYAAWPAKRVQEEYRQVQPSDVDTLLVSGSIDFDTPAQFATEELLPSLSNGQQIILSEYGHISDILRHQPEALERLLTSFYDTGTADDSRYIYQPMDFRVGFGYPEQAKLAVGAIVLVIAILVVVVRVWLNRKKM
jgi:pimeloyl-ACP methyl ester carboxylesterase